MDFQYIKMYSCKANYTIKCCTAMQCKCFTDDNVLDKARSEDRVHHPDGLMYGKVKMY